MLEFNTFSFVCHTVRMHHCPAWELIGWIMLNVAVLTAPYTGPSRLQHQHCGLPWSDRAAESCACPEHGHGGVLADLAWNTPDRLHPICCYRGPDDNTGDAAQLSGYVSYPSPSCLNSSALCVVLSGRVCGWVAWEGENGTCVWFFFNSSGKKLRV